MTRHALVLLALYSASCASVHRSLPAGQPGMTPAVQEGAAAAALAPGVTPPIDAPVEVAALPRAKHAASGAQLAEQWSPALRLALAQHAAEPTVRHEIELAHAYRDVGILDQAYDRYDAVARRDRHQVAAWDGLARIWRDWGYPGLALPDAHRAVWADPRSPIARNTLGTVLKLLGSNAEARDQFALAAALDPQATYAHYNLGLACLAQRHYIAAAEAFERAAALDPSLEIARLRATEARQHQPDAAAGKRGSHERR